MRIYKDNRGQSLVELLVALFILIVAITATIVLIVTSINAGRDSRDKLVGTNLAREALEIVRNIRDSNWTDPTAADWHEGLTGGNTAVPIIDGASAFSLDFTVSDFTDTTWTRLRETGGAFVQDSADTGNSRYYRMLYINPICRDAAGDDNIATDLDNTDACGNGVHTGYPQEVGLRVIAEVRYPSADSDKKVQLEERLYDWQVL